MVKINFPVSLFLVQEITFFEFVLIKSYITETMLVSEKATYKLLRTSSLQKFHILVPLFLHFFLSLCHSRLFSTNSFAL